MFIVILQLEVKRIYECFEPKLLKLLLQCPPLPLCNIFKSKQIHGKLACTCKITSLSKKVISISVDLQMYGFVNGNCICLTVYITDGSYKWATIGYFLQKCNYMRMTCIFWMVHPWIVLQHNFPWKNVNITFGLKAPISITNHEQSLLPWREHQHPPILTTRLLTLVGESWYTPVETFDAFLYFCANFKHLDFPL